MERKETIEKAFDILENEHNIQYTVKYTKEYLIDGFLQTKIEPWKWFEFSRKDSLIKQIERMVDIPLNRNRGEEISDYIIRLTDTTHKEIISNINEDLKDVMETAFTILEEKNAIRYTKKYTREYLIEGFSQIGIEHWKWFKFKDNSSLGRQLSRMISNKLDKPVSRPWFHHLIHITGFKKCSKCGEIKEEIEENFCKDNTTNIGYSTQCKKCDIIRRDNTFEQRKEYQKVYQPKWHKIKKEKEPGYFKAIRAKRRAAKKERTVKWANLKEIKEFYDKCPEGHHVDHVIPLQNDLVCGLHVIENLQYLIAEENLRKSNKFDIVEFNRL